MFLKVLQDLVTEAWDLDDPTAFQAREVVLWGLKRGREGHFSPNRLLWTSLLGKQAGRTLAASDTCPLCVCSLCVCLPRVRSLIYRFWRWCPLLPYLPSMSAMCPLVVFSLSSLCPLLVRSWSALCWPFSGSMFWHWPSVCQLCVRSLVFV